MGVSLTALGESPTLNHSDHFINYENWHLLEEAGQRAKSQLSRSEKPSVWRGPVGLGKSARVYNRTLRVPFYTRSVGGCYQPDRCERLLFWANAGLGLDVRSQPISGNGRLDTEEVRKFPTRK